MTNPHPFETGDNCPKYDVPQFEVKGISECVKTPNVVELPVPIVTFATPIMPPVNEPCLCFGFNIENEGIELVDARKLKDGQPELLLRVEQTKDCCEGMFDIQTYMALPCIPFSINKPKASIEVVKRLDDPKVELKIGDDKECGLDSSLKIEIPCAKTLVWRNLWFKWPENGRVRGKVIYSWYNRVNANIYDKLPIDSGFTYETNPIDRDDPCPWYQDMTLTIPCPTMMDAEYYKETTVESKRAEASDMESDEDGSVGKQKLTARLVPDPEKCAVKLEMEGTLLDIPCPEGIEVGPKSVGGWGGQAGVEVALQKVGCTITPVVTCTGSLPSGGGSGYITSVDTRSVTIAEHGCSGRDSTLKLKRDSSGELSLVVDDVDHVPHVSGGESTANVSVGHGYATLKLSESSSGCVTLTSAGSVTDVVSVQGNNGDAVSGRTIRFHSEQDSNVTIRSVSGGNGVVDIYIGVYYA